MLQRSFTGINKVSTDFYYSSFFFPKNIDTWFTKIFVMRIPCLNNCQIMNYKFILN